jgi:isoaspartyl peptidase/L-asparaginase-like protein (Ntn-hydrolase superfamily)
VAIQRIIEKTPDVSNVQVGILAINKKGEIGAYAIQKSFHTLSIPKQLKKYLIQNTRSMPL